MVADVVVTVELTVVAVCVVLEPVAVLLDAVVLVVVTHVPHSSGQIVASTGMVLHG